MPTYEYECRRCGHVFERFQNITDEPVKRCPKCKGKVERLIGTGAGVIFKGSGFYSTDYRSDSYKNAAKQEKASATSKSNSTASGKTSDSSTQSKAGASAAPGKA